VVQDNDNNKKLFNKEINVKKKSLVTTSNIQTKVKYFHFKINNETGSTKQKLHTGIQRHSCQSCAWWFEVGDAINSGVPYP
jgi:hypothetical protein